jgi:hypothetical protein
MAYVGQLASSGDYSCEQRATKVHVRRHFVDHRCRSVDHSRACAMFNGWVAHILCCLFYLGFFGHKLQSRHLKTRSGPKYEIRQYASFPFPLRLSLYLTLASRGRKSVRLSPRLSSSHATRVKISFPPILHSQDFDFCSDTIMYRRLILTLVVASPRIP